MSFAYLHERFPAFSQTFVYREVAAMRALGVVGPVFSIREPKGEPAQDFPPELEGVTTYLPEAFGDLVARDARFRRDARRALRELVAQWGDDREKRRIHEALWLRAECRRLGITHVHAHFAGMATRTAFWLRQLGGPRYSFTAHANDVFCDEPSERLEQLIAGAEFVATETEYSARFLRTRHPAHAARIHRVFNGIRLTPPAPRRPAAPPVVLGIGRYIEKKGFADLIAACALLPHIPLTCRIVGQGPLEDELRALAEPLGGRVQVTGPRPQSQIAAALAEASVFVLPCVQAADGGSDNLPTVIMEAMAAGVPVISTPVAGIPEMIEDGVTGFLVPERDPGALATRLAELLGSPERASAMGQAGRERCESLFAVERTAGELRRLLASAGAFQRPRGGWWQSLFVR